MFKQAFILAVLFTSILAIDLLRPNQCLYQGQSLVSENDCFRLIMQLDGNLVLYRQSDGIALWSSRTPRSCTNRACMQSDGNFVTYDCHNKPTWASRTDSRKNKGSWILLQNDGNIVIYKPIWASSTVTNC